MCYKELWQKQKAEKEKKWIDNHKGADVAWCSQELIPTLRGREEKDTHMRVDIAWCTQVQVPYILLHHSYNPRPLWKYIITENIYRGVACGWPLLLIS